eukprot:gene2972-3837_t
MPDLLRQSGIDLGAWAEEKYAIPAAPPREPLDEE